MSIFKVKNIGNHKNFINISYKGGVTWTFRDYSIDYIALLIVTLQNFL